MEEDKKKPDTQCVKKWTFHPTSGLEKFQIAFNHPNEIVSLKKAYYENVSN